MASSSACILIADGDSGNDCELELLSNEANCYILVFMDSFSWKELFLTFEAE